MFEEILRLIAELRPKPLQRQHETLDGHAFNRNRRKEENGEISPSTITTIMLVRSGGRQRRPLARCARRRRPPPIFFFARSRMAMAGAFLARARVRRATADGAGFSPSETLSYV
jgi:hypothetical protein